MERINPFAFYGLSTALKTVAAYQGGEKGGDCFMNLFAAQNAIGELLSGKPIQLGVSMASAAGLKSHLDGIVDLYVWEDAPSGGHKKLREDSPPVPQFQWEWYRTLLAKFETIFNEEMREAAAYYVPRRGIFYTPALIDSAEEAFPEEIRGHLPDKTKADWRAAGRCLAFNLHSASGFHVARAVEGTIEAYYQVFCGKPGETLNGWHDYVVALRKVEADPKPTDKTLTEIGQMKDDYRNPIVHPRVVLAESDARMLFANGESLIIAMAQEIAKAKNGVQPTLALTGTKTIAGGEGA